MRYVAPVFLFALAALSACSSDKTSTGSVKAYSAPARMLNICSGYGCVYEDKIKFSASQTNRLKSIMASGRGSEQRERAAIKRAVSRMESWTRSKLGFAGDVKRSFQRYANVRGQMDCVDETRNTTAYLKFLSSRGFLKYHRVARSYAAKGFVLNGVMPHRSAVIISKSGNRFAVDSWPANNGGKPLVLPLSVWHSKTI